MNKALESLTKHELIALLKSEREAVSKHQNRVQKLELVQAEKDRTIAQNRNQIASYQNENSLKKELMVLKIKETLVNGTEIERTR